MICNFTRHNEKIIGIFKEIGIQNAISYMLYKWASFFKIILNITLNDFTI